jgi:hypothetical protein
MIETEAATVPMGKGVCQRLCDEGKAAIAQERGNEENETYAGNQAGSSCG